MTSAVVKLSHVRLAGVAAIALMSGMSGEAFAQDASASSAPAAAEGSSLGDIIVTANRRKELLQSVPTPITVFDTTRIREQNLSTPRDLIGKVPSVQVGSNGTQRSTEIIVIRGQGQTFLSPIGVVQYFAEVPLVQGGVVAVQGGPGTFFDLEALQILRGPQGTLFGRNTTGGAVLLGPKKPTSTFGGYVQGQIGNYKDREFEGALNIPIVADKLMVRLAGKKVDRDGFTKDVGPQAYGFSDVCAPSPAGCFASAVGTRSPGYAGKDYDDRHYWHARASILFRPAEGIENYLVGYYSKSHDNGTGFILDNLSTVTKNSTANIGANVGYQRPLTNIFDSTIANQILTAQKGLGARKVAMNVDQFTRLKAWGVIDTLSVDISENLTLRAIGSYQRLRQNYAWDVDGSILPTSANLPPVVPANSPWAEAGSPAYVTNLSQITAEPQIQGQFLENKLNFVVGMFYSYVKPESVQGTGGFNSGSYSPGTYYDIRTRNLAGYAQGSLDLGAFAPTLDGLTLTAGLRVSNDRIVGSRYASNFLVLPYAAATFESTEPTWTVGVDYKLNPNVLLFGKVSRGYKAANFNYLAPRPSALTSRPEFVTNFEVGAKTDFKVGTVPVRLNVNAYHMNYKDIQRSDGDNFPNGTFNAAGVCIGTNGQPNGSSTCLDQGAIVFNAEGARINGIELEGTIQPLPGFELSANYSYMDAKYTKFTLVVPPDPLARTIQSCSGPVARPFPGQPATTIDISCQPFLLAPKNLFNLTARYTAEIDAGGKMVFNVGYSFVDKTWYGSARIPADEPRAYEKSYMLLNASVEWNGVLGTSLDARAFVTNLTNKLYRVGAYTGLNTASGYTHSTYGEPRMYGFSLRYRFGE